MLSLKRLVYVLLIVFGICGIFILYSINENNNKIVTISNQIGEDKEIIRSGSVQKSEEPCFYVVGSEEKEIYQDIYRNVGRLMEDMKVSWCKKNSIAKEDLENKQAVFVFCDEVIYPYVDLRLLGQFIEGGGKVILAAGVAEGYEDSYLMPVLGIIEKSIKENYQNYHFIKSLFPLQEEYMTYDGYNISTWLKVRSDAEIYVEDTKKQVPVLYSYPYGKGETLIVNTTLLSDSRCMGLLTAGISNLFEEFVYPVMGTENIYLDNFPIVTYVNDPVCMKLYGRTTEAFVRDIVWPVFQGMAVRNEIKYTSSVLSVASDEAAFPAISESLFHTMGKSALQYHGEMAYAADCREATSLYRNEEFIKSFENTFQNYNISALTMMSEQPVQESMEILGEDIKAVRGKLDAENPRERMAFLENYYVFPEATKGANLEGGNMFAIACVLASHGMVSHTFDVNKLISIDENSPSWDTDKVQLGDFEKRILRKTNYLQKVTLTETKNPLKSYENLEYTWKRNGNELEISANQFMKGQPFFIRTEGKIAEVEGAEYENIGNNYYILRLNSSKAVIIIGKGEGE